MSLQRVYNPTFHLLPIWQRQAVAFAVEYRFDRAAGLCEPRSDLRYTRLSRLIDILLPLRLIRHQVAVTCIADVKKPGAVVILELPGVRGVNSQLALQV